MITIIILLSILVIIIIFISILLITRKKYMKLFNYHFYKDPLVTYYSEEEYNLLSESIKIKYDDKNNLDGKIFYLDNYDPKKLIIYSHGMLSNYNAYMQEIGLLCQNGFKVLAYNYYGVETSDGNTMQGFGNSLICLDKIINYIKSNKDLSKLDLYCIGHSWGAYATLNIVKYYSDIKGLIAIAPPLGVRNFVSNKLLLPFIYINEFINTGKYGISNSLKSLKKYNGKVLIIHSTNDPIINFNNSTKLLKDTYSNKSNFKFIIVDDKFHNPEYKKESVDLLMSYASKLNELSKEEQEKLKKNTDFHKLGEVDLDIYQEIIKYINE